jgi:autotransporter-associated beta strand protein
MKNATTKTPPNSNQTTLLTFAVALLAAFTFNTTAQAVNYTWDPTSGDGQITDGTGNWDTTTSNWTIDGGANNTTIVGNDPFATDLFFGGGAAGTAGTITLTETGTSFGSLRFDSPNAGTYNLDLNGNIVNIRRSSGTIKVYADTTISDSAGGGELALNTSQFNDYSSGSTLSVSAVVADRLNATGVVRTYSTITLDLSGVNTYTGGTELYNTSTLRISGAGQLGSGTYAGNITMNENADFTYASSADQTLSGVISDDGTGNGSNSLTKEGSGTLTLTNTNTYTGGTTISNGTLEIQNSEAVGTGRVNLSGGGVLEFGADSLILSENVRILNNSGTKTIRLDSGGASHLNQLSGTLDIRRSVAGEFVIDVGNTDQLLVNNAIVTQAGGGAGLTKEGDGLLRIEHDSSYAGDTVINGGTLRIRNAVGSQGWGAGAIYINNGSTLEFAGTQQTVMTTGDTVTFDSNGGGSILLSKNPIWRTNATITTTGGAKNTISGTYLNGQGGHNLTLDTAVGTDPYALEVSSRLGNIGITKNGAGTVALTHVTNDMGSRSITINDGTLEVAGAGRLKSGNFDNTIAINGDAGTIFRYNSSQTQALSGVISGVGSLEKDNSSTLTLSADNSYSGNTDINAGTLALTHATLNNIISNSSSIDVATGASFDVSGVSSGFELASGQTLSGSGTVSGGMTLTSGSILSPGNSPGTMATGAQTWLDGSSYLWEINDSGGTQGADPGWDFLDITGALDLTNLGAGGFTIDIDSLNGAVAGDANGFNTWTKGAPGDFDYSFTIATASSGISGFDAADFTLDSSGFSNAPSWDWGIVLDGNSLVLQAYAVPEPSSTALLGLGGLALMLRRKRS